ncbi:unnamed protein product [Phytomonas sp. EM1]|nr:unnamed protein product [Phytomonas sp. EM1]|eukprot:CCW65764.1 unnamed protein product [Phytomonas sp. isolate EM1]
MPCDEDERDPSSTKRQREVGRKEFGTFALYHSFEEHVTNTQNAFLKGDNQLAEREATLALRIRPTAHLFALLAVIAESKGQYDRASDFRLLQAFLAHDMVLWEELLHEFLSEQLYYKSVVCLQRLSAMEKCPVRYRTLQLQLADLLIGLGEIRRATNVLVPLWNSSRCRDFDVFALLSSLYFQLGKWSSLEGLITSSLKNTFCVDMPVGDAVPLVSGVEANTARDNVDTSDGNPDSKKETKRKRVSKRVRFYNVPEDTDKVDAEDKENTTTPFPQSGLTNKPDVMREMPDSEAEDLDEFDFTSLTEETTRHMASDSALPRTPGDGSAEPIKSLYGDRIDLSTPDAKRNFLILINVHTELLNESGKFMETVQVMEFTAACLHVPILDLPPDLLVRLGTAYAFLEDMKQPCKDVVHYLIDTCPMDTYADVLLDMAMTLQKTGMHTEARMIFASCVRYYDAIHRRLAADVLQLERAIGVADGGEKSHGGEEIRTKRLQALHERLKEVETELREVKTVLAAAHYGQAQSGFSIRDIKDAEQEAKMALSFEPDHLQARLLLGRLYFYEKKDLDEAVRILTPKETDAALCRIQLGAFLVRIFFKSRRYVEVIALGVSMFEMILSSAEDGDTMSVAPGSSRRSSAPFLLPTLSRATSAIIPSVSVVGMIRGSGGVDPSNRLSASLAASIRSGTSVVRQQLARRDRASLTTTAYGASAAASIAAGWSREDEEAKLKDSSTIFRFNRKRRAGGSREGLQGKGQTGMGTTPDDVDAVLESKKAKEEEEVERKRRRIEEVTKRDPRSFWEAPKDGEEVEAPTDRPEGAPVDIKEEETAAVNEPSSACKKPNTKQTPPLRPAEMPKMANFTTVGEKDRDLSELEGFEESLKAQRDDAAGDAPRPERDAEAVEDEVSPSSYELPSLEEVSKQFTDPAMAQLFLKVSSNEPPTSPLSGALRTDARVDLSRNPSHPEGVSGVMDRVTAREAITALGRAEFLALAVSIVESYSALGKFSEAKEFASVALIRFSKKRIFGQMGNPLERPLRLAVLRAALAAGESEDAFRVGFRLLQEESLPEEHSEVVELMHGVLSRCEDRSSILYRAFAESRCDVVHLVLLANRYYQTRSYTRVLNLYLVALERRPRDIFLNFMVGLCYVLCSHQKRVTLREECVSAGVYYLSQYQTLLVALDPSRMGEALYNSARALHYLRLYHLCAPLYERIIRDLCVPEECSIAIQRAARFNLYFLYRWGSGNRELGLAALQAT